MANYEDIQKLVENSYKKNKEQDEVKGYYLDGDISTSENKVYVPYDTTKNAIVVNRGTIGTLNDWSNNLSYITGTYKKTDRFKRALSTQKEAINKYGNVDNIGHSQGAVVSKQLNKKGLVNNAILVNPASLGEKNKKNETTLRNEGDIISSLSKKKNTTSFKTTSWNPLYNHSTSFLKKK